MERFEVFRKLASGEAKRVETAATLGEARIRWSELRTMFPADYFILDHENSLVIIPAPDFPREDRSCFGMLLASWLRSIKRSPSEMLTYHHEDVTQIHDPVESAKD